MKALSYIFLCLLILSVAGCGYGFQGGTTILPPDVKRVYIPLVENNSTETGMSNLLTEALRDRFERFGAVTVVDDIGEADAVLTATLVKVDRDSATVTSNTDTTLQQDATMVMAAELRRVSGPLLWRDPSISVSTSYGVSSDVIVTSSSDFATSGFSAQNLQALEQTGSREVARGQEAGAFAALAEEAARVIYESAVAADF